MARQKLGQHFLRSQGVLEKIARAACGDRAPLAVEIGPGHGALTAHLLEHADRVVAIELDSALAHELRERWRDDPRIEIIHEDAVGVDLGRWGAGVLAGNLPYYVATSIISRYVREPGSLVSATFLIQEEVAARITARPGTRDYGYLSVECQFLAAPEYLFRVPPGAFQPPPKVDSAVIRLTPHQRIAPVDPDRFLRFVSACFRHKRKTLRNNLAGLFPREVLDRAPDLSKRAEQLSIQDFLNLYQAMAPPDEASATSIITAEPGSGVL